MVLLVHYLERTDMGAGIDAKKIAKEDYQAWLET